MIVQLNLGLALHGDDFLQQRRTEAAPSWLLDLRPALFKPIQIEVGRDNAPYFDELDASS